MIALAVDCLLFETRSGETVPLSVEVISAELANVAPGLLDEEFANHAVNAVCFFFKNDLGRSTVSAEEFAQALEKVLRGFGLCHEPPPIPRPGPPLVELDLCGVLNECGFAGELLFYARLRDELRQQLKKEPKVVRFRGLRGCAKQLAGAQRWSPRCRGVQAQIVRYLRECLCAEGPRSELSLVVE